MKVKRQQCKKRIRNCSRRKNYLRLILTSCSLY